MNWVAAAIRSPVKTAVGVLLLVLFGGLALVNIPVQLTPSVEQPMVIVQTLWPGASPAEIEREIVDEQEEQLKGLDGLLEMESSSLDSRAEIRLRFAVGSDSAANLLKVSNRLEQVPRYPDNAEKPVLLTADPNINAMAWLTLGRLPEAVDQTPVWTLRDFVDDEVKPLLERVPGIAKANLFGGRERELQVIVDAARLAAHQLTIGQLAAALESENRNFSGGDFSEGKRRYVVRTVGEYASAREVEQVVVAMRGTTPVTIGDVARVELGYRKADTRMLGASGEMLGLAIIKEPGANTLDAMTELRRVILELDRDLLADRGLRLHLAYDQSDYIYSAIGLVRQSMLLGGLLAIVALLLYLRSRTSTLIVALTIPISLVGTFLIMKGLGRTLNVVSMAGMAFAVGMVVDNSIVVLENIFRHRQNGKSRYRAALEGTNEVFGAVLASTLTTIAVFVPILFVEEEAGQLFRDIALAISASVALSLVVSVTVIPALAAKLLDAAGSADTEPRTSARHRGPRQLWGGVALAGRLADWIANRVEWICRTTLRRLAIVLAFTVGALLLSWLLIPKAEYLPLGNVNFVFGIVLPPPGYNLEEVISFYDLFTEELGHLWQETAEDTTQLPAGGISEFFYGVFDGQVFVGASSREELRVRELIPEIQRANSRIPGTIAFTQQFSIFQTDIAGGRSIDIEITGPDLLRLIALGGRVMGAIGTVLPGAQAFPIPGLDLGNPEVHLRASRRRAAELGISNRELGLIVDVLVDGAKVSDYQHDGREIDLVLRGEVGDMLSTHRLEQLPIATADGRQVSLGSVAAVELRQGPVQIDHRERQRTITIQVTPPDEIPLQEAMERIDAGVLAPMRQAGDVGGLYRVSYAGSADKLTQTRQALQWNLLLAILITYLLMAALFESFLYPLVILFSVPMAALGGFLGLGALNLLTYQALDVLTMLGFVILVGTVVNNAILVVHQALNHMRADGLSPVDAIRESTRTRVRPIFMSVSTSLCGMLPLVFFPGAGSELYRGLGSVVIGGLAVSTVFTLFLVPALFSLVLDARAALARRWGSKAPVAEVI